MAAKNQTKKAAAFRLFFQVAWAALTNGYVQGFAQSQIYGGNLKQFCTPGLNCYSCPGAFFACPIGSLQNALANGAFKASLYVLGFLSLFGALVGRGVCGFLCPFGLAQDLLHKIPFFKKRKNLPLHKLLSGFRYVVLALLVIILPAVAVDEFGFGKPWFCKYVCPSGSLFAGLPLVAGNEYLRQTIGFLFSWKMSLLLLIAVLSLWAWRPFCKYICPLGAIYGLFNKNAFFKLGIDAERCTKCGSCQRACKADIKTWLVPNSADCVRCLDCLDACPTNAIRIDLLARHSTGIKAEGLAR